MEKPFPPKTAAKMAYMSQSFSRSYENLRGQILRRRCGEARSPDHRNYRLAPIL